MGYGDADARGYHGHGPDMLALSFWPYVALIFVLVVSSAGPPLPASLTLTLAAVAARQGHNNLVVLLVVATLATIAGDITGYMIGRLLGNALGRGSPTARWRTHRLTRHVTSAMVWMDARGGIGGPLVFVSRWGLTPIAPAINLIVGARAYPLRKFVVWDSAGEALWVARVALPAYALGKVAGLASLPLAVGATIVFGALITFGVGRFMPVTSSRQHVESGTGAYSNAPAIDRERH